MNRRPAMILVGCLAVAGAIGAADALSQLGVTPAIAKRELIGGLERGLVNYSVGSRAFKAASGPVRAQILDGAIGWAKTYTASAEFKAAYAEMRNGRKPSPPVFSGTPEEEVQQRVDEQKKSLEQSRAQLASLPPDVRKQVEEGLKQSEAAIRQFDTPEMRKMQLTGIVSARDEATKRYNESLQKWQAEFPEDPRPLIARRLKSFLEVSADVDYAARLESRNGKMVFANEAYEDKSSEWKLCFRAGKEAVDAARAAAASWLKELETAPASPVNQRP